MSYIRTLLLRKNFLVVDSRFSEMGKIMNLVLLKIKVKSLKNHNFENQNHPQ